MTLGVSVAEIVENSNNPLLKIHPSWERVLLGDVANILNGFAFASSKFSKNEGFPLIRIRDIGKSTTDAFYSGDYDETYVVKSGDLLIGMDGDFNSARWTGENGLLNQRVCKVTLKSPDYNPKFLEYVLPGYLKAINDHTSAVTVKHLSSRTVAEIPLPYPPLPEQERIVAKIEELFTQLEAGTAALKRVRAGLKRYKASVLKAAVEGRLFENREIESSDDLPDDWRMAKVGDIAEHRLGKMLDKEKNKGELRPYLRNINVRWFEFDLSDIQYMRVTDEELQNITVRKGDLVVCEGGEPGRAAVWNKDEPFIIQKALHRVRPSTDILPTYLMYCLASDANTGRLEKHFTGSTIMHFTGQAFRAYEIPLPPLAEQQRIVAEVERRLSVAQEVESVVAASVARASRLRQSVLKSAFEGRLG
jgi:type I restriction enzyme, S subunit